MAQVVTVAVVEPKRMELDPCVLPKDAPTPGITVTELPETPAAGLIHAICNTGVELTVSAMEVVAESVPDDVPVEVPWIVIADVPALAEVLAVSDSKLLPVVGFVPKEAVTPAGSPDAVRVTAPLNPPRSVTLIASVPPESGLIVRAAADGVRVKLPVPPVEPMVSVIVVLAESVPDVPVIVTVDDPTAAVLLAFRVRTLAAVTGFVPKAAVTPAGNPEAARVTPPVNEPTSDTEMVSVPLLPRATDNELEAGWSVNPPLEPQVVPLSANDTGTAFVAPFHVPLNPTPVRLPPAGILPL